MSWQTWDLETDGRGMISASAGTGKTWTVAVLYIRLLLERQLSPERIVVTTFTNAAVAELSERLRSRIRDALNWHAHLFDASAPNAGFPPGDALLPWLQSRWQDDAVRKNDYRRLLAAWSAMDRASILTLHGFCSALSSEFPLLTQAPLQGESLMSEEDLRDQVAKDVWRAQTQGEGAPATGFLDRFKSLQQLQLHLRTVLQPKLALAEPDSAALPPLRDWVLGREGQRAITQLETGQSVGWEWFGKASSLRKGRGDAVLEFLRSVAAGEPVARRFSWDDIRGEKWSSATVNAQKVQFAESFSPRLMDAFAAVGEYEEAMALHAVYRDARARRDALLAKTNATTFDQMIHRVFAALQPDAPHAAALADAVFAKYPVALIDESQDTDQIQYAIMDRIYRHDDGRKRGRMILIGDVKQAIYGFRGGDVETFTAAADDADATLTLDTNFRSTPEVLEGFNSFYRLFGESMTANPAATTVRYVPLAPPGGAVRGRYTVGGLPVDKPVKVSVMDMADWGDKPKIGAVRLTMMASCANGIAAMLAGGEHVIDGETLQPGDIAVLVKRNEDVKTMRHLLAERGVPVAARTRQSVLDSDWFLDLSCVIAAADDPYNAAKAAAARATRLFPESEAVDPVQWAKVLQHSGVLGLVLWILRTAGPQLQSRPDGERALTDLRHLGELLQNHYARTRDVQQALNALAAADAQENDAGLETDAPATLRMESDAARVQVMTVHASKGLEFKVVMLPLLFDLEYRPGRNELPMVRDPDQLHSRLATECAGDRERLDTMGNDELHRLQYVAMTRAKFACHIGMVVSDRPKSPLQQRWRSADSPFAADLPGLLIRRNWPDAWQTAVHWQGPPLAVPANVAQRPLPAPRERQWLSSFTTITKGPQSMESRAGHDEGDDGSAAITGENGTAAHPELLKLSSVMGTEFGNALHRIMEALVGDPAAQGNREALTRQWFRAYGMPGESIAKQAGKIIDATLRTPIALRGGGSVRLGALQPACVQTELEFHFAHVPTRIAALRDIAERFGEGDLWDRVTVSELRGMLKGEIDLLFEQNGRYFVLDYKGNFLGTSVADYESAALEEAMRARHYGLQAFLYSLALDRLLRQRWGDAGAQRNGGAVYVFMRAIGLSETSGVWSRQFAPALLRETNQLLAGAGEGG